MATENSTPKAREGNYNENDVLLGRFKFCRENEGNKRLKRLVHERYDEYELADLKTDYMDVGTKRDKKMVKEEIVASIKANGGRFLRCQKNSGFWEELSQVEAIARVTEELKNLRCHQKQKEAIQHEHKRQKTSHVASRAAVGGDLKESESDDQKCMTDLPIRDIDAANAMLGLAETRSPREDSVTRPKVQTPSQELDARSETPPHSPVSSPSCRAKSSTWTMPPSSQSRSISFTQIDQIDDFLNDLCISPSRVVHYKRQGFIGFTGRIR